MAKECLKKHRDRDDKEALLGTGCVYSCCCSGIEGGVQGLGPEYIR